MYGKEAKVHITYMLFNNDTVDFYIGQINTTMGADLYTEVLHQFKTGMVNKTVDAAKFLGNKCNVTTLYTMLDTNPDAFIQHYAKRLMDNYALIYRSDPHCLNIWYPVE